MHDGAVGINAPILEVDDVVSGLNAGPSSAQVRKMTPLLA